MQFIVEERKGLFLPVLAFAGFLLSFYLGTQNSILFFSYLPSTVPESGILLFYQPSCPHCVAEIPVIKELIRRGYRVHAVNVLEHPDLAAEFGVNSTPTIVILPLGTKLVGEHGLEEVLDALEGKTVEEGATCSLEVETCGIT